MTPAHRKRTNLDNQTCCAEISTPFRWRQKIVQKTSLSERNIVQQVQKHNNGKGKENCTHLWKERPFYLCRCLPLEWQKKRQEAWSAVRMSWFLTLKSTRHLQKRTELRENKPVKGLNQISKFTKAEKRKEYFKTTSTKIECLDNNAAMKQLTKLRIPCCACSSCRSHSWLWTLSTSDTSLESDVCEAVSFVSFPRTHGELMD